MSYQSFPKSSGILIDGSSVNFSVTDGYWKPNLPTGSGLSVLQTSPTLITPNVTNLITINHNSLGATAGDGILLSNATSAVSGTQQYSPAIHWLGDGYGTTAGTSQVVDVRNYLVPVQGTTPTYLLTWDGQINSAGFATLMTLSSAGTLTLPSVAISPTGAVTGVTTLSASGQISSNRPAIATISTDGFSAQNVTASTAGVPVQYSPRFRLTGSAYNSVSTLSETDDWIFENQTITAAGTTSSSFAGSAQINGGGYNKRFSISSGGQISSLRDGVGTAIAISFGSSNSSAATSGSQNQYSGGFYQQAKVWDGSASQTVEWFTQNQTSNAGGASYSGDYVWLFQSSGGGYVEKMRLVGRTGTLTLPGTLNLSNQAGTATLSSGTVTISTANVTASSSIHVTLKDAANTSLTTTYEVPSSSRTPGSPGSFVIRANIAAGTINTADTSTLDWVVFN